MGITKYNPGDARLGASLACFGVAALSYLKPQMVNTLLVHRRFTMLSALAFGASYLVASNMYTRGNKLQSHKLAAANGAIVSGTCFFNGMARRSPLWYAMAVVPAILTMKDVVLLTEAWGEQKKVLMFQKAPNNQVQRAHVTTLSGPSTDMPREEQFSKSSYAATQLNQPVQNQNLDENEHDLVSGPVNATSLDKKERTRAAVQAHKSAAEDHKVAAAAHKREARKIEKAAREDRL